MHTHHWTLSIAHSRPGTLRRFFCPCGAWGYQQIGYTGNPPIRAYLAPVTPILLKRWQEEASRQPTLSDPVGTQPRMDYYRPPTPAFAWYQRDDGHWVRARG